MPHLSEPDRTDPSPTEAAPFGDFVQPFRIERSGLRGRLVRLSGALEDILGPHDYPPSVAALLSETVALAALLSTALKYDGIFTLQTHGDGPVGTMMADVTSAGGLRGYARYAPDRLAAADKATGGVIPRLLGAGHLAFTVDQGPDTERYQGIVELTGATLADCAHTYFRQSEQLESAIVLVSAVGDGAPPRAAAITIQRLPPAPGADTEELAEEWRRAVILMSSITKAELLDPALSPRQMLWRLYHRDGVRVYRQRPLRHACRCSRTKVERTLMAFPKSEIEAMSDDGSVTVTCEFCRQSYVFSPEALAALYPA